MTATTTTQTPGAAVARPLRPGCPSAQPACARPSLPPPPRPAGCARPARRLSVPGPAFAFQRRLLSHAPRQTSSPPDRRPGQARAPADDALAAPRPFPRDGRPLVPSPSPDPDAHTGRVCRGGDNAETPPAPRRLLARAACSSAPPPSHARAAGARLPRVACSRMRPARPPLPQATRGEPARARLRRPLLPATRGGAGAPPPRITRPRARPARPPLPPAPRGATRSRARPARLPSPRPCVGSSALDAHILDAHVPRGGCRARAGTRPPASPARDWTAAVDGSRRMTPLQTSSRPGGRPGRVRAPADAMPLRRMGLAPEMAWPTTPGPLTLRPTTSSLERVQCEAGHRIERGTEHKIEHGI